MTNTREYYQPFVRGEVEDYRELETETPIRALFYEFTIRPRQAGGKPGYCELRYIPSGGTDIFLMVKGERRLMEFVGLCTQKKEILGFCGAKYFGVRLSPGTRVSYRDVCLNDMVDEERFFRGNDSPLQPIFEELAGARTLEEKAGLFCRYFGKEMKREEVDQVTKRLLEEIRSAHGAVRLRELADKAHYSERHISRIFRESMGISIKTFSRIVRFQTVVGEMLSRPHEAVSDYLGGTGYADQAHFQREFKAYTGLTPQSFARQLGERQADLRFKRTVD